MRFLKLLLALLVLSQVVSAQDHKAEAESIFKKYIINEDRTVAKMIINLDDSLYSEYCKGVFETDMTKKRRQFIKFVSLNPKYGLPQAFLQLGNSYSNTNKTDSALFYFNIAQLKDSTYLQTYVSRGELLFAMDRCDEAVEDFNMVIKMMPEYDNSYMMRGLCKLGKKKYDHALADFNKVIKLNPNNAQAYLMKGVVYREQKDYLIAIENWKQAGKISQSSEKVADMMIAEVEKIMKEEKQKEKEAERAKRK